MGCLAGCLCPSVGLVPVSCKFHRSTLQQSHYPCTPLSLVLFKLSRCSTSALCKMDCIFMTTCKLCVSPCYIHSCTDYIVFSTHSPSHMLLAGTPQMCELPHLMFSPSLAVATFHSPGEEHYARDIIITYISILIFITPTMMFISYVHLCSPMFTYVNGLPFSEGTIDNFG